MRDLRIDQSHALDIMVRHGTVMMQLVVGMRDGHSVKRREPQRSERCDRPAERERLHSAGERTVPRIQFVKRRHAFGYVVIRELRQHERVGRTERQCFETTRFGTRIVDDVAHSPLLSDV